MVLRKDLLRMITVSLCMIVKNEEAVLSRCLDSYAGTYDELIIVDTGSMDKTKEIALRYTDRIFDFKWTGNFSDARNYSFSLAHCDYIFCADADEVLDEKNRKALIELKSVLLSEIDIVQMYYVNSSDHNSVYNFKKELRPKLYKRLRNFTWISPIHETVRLEPVVYDSDIEIQHLPTSDHSKRDFASFIRAAKSGERLENYVLIMFCKELFISGSDDDFLNAADVFENIFALEERNEECRKNAACVLARIYRLKNDYNNFFKVALKDMVTSPCAEMCMELGNYFYDIKDYDEAVIWYINAADETESIIDIRTSRELPLLALSKVYAKMSYQLESSDPKLALTFKNMSYEYKAKADAITTS